MDKENLFEYFRTMINSSTKDPKYLSISVVKVADILGLEPTDIEQRLKEFVSEGRLLKQRLQDPPHYDIYALPPGAAPS